MGGRYKCIYMYMYMCVKEKLGEGRRGVYTTRCEKQ